MKPAANQTRRPVTEHPLMSWALALVMALVLGLATGLSWPLTETGWMLCGFLSLLTVLCLVYGYAQLFAEPDPAEVGNAPQAEKAPRLQVFSHMEARPLNGFANGLMRAVAVDTLGREIEAPSVQAMEPSPTNGMNMAQRIIHVGGRNPPGSTYVEFGSIQAVEALVGHALRDAALADAPKAVQP